MGAAEFFDDADLLVPVVPALAILPSLAWIVFFVLLGGLTILAIRMEWNALMLLQVKIFFFNIICKKCAIESDVL